MMGFWDCLILGWNIAADPSNLIYCFVGVLMGTLIGVLPGIGPPGAIALLLPISFGINPASAMILLAGIYYGAAYGGSTTSILLNIPGESSSVVTCLDGHQMAKQGRAGPALGISALGSFIAGTFGIVLLMMLAVPLSTFALRFGPPEYVGLMILGLTIVTYLSHGSLLKALIMAVLGIALSQIGTDLITGRLRFTFGFLELEDGIGLVPMVMGLFGIGEVLMTMDESGEIDLVKTKIKNLLPSIKDWKDSIGAIIRGTFIGFFLGILPGGGSVLASFLSYGVEKKISRHPEKFGTGVIEGVAAPESANNSATAGAFIPLFTLGIPSNAVTALLLGALMIHGVQPGPMLFHRNPEVFWGTVVSMYLGNAMLVLLNLPLIGIWVKLLKIPTRILSPLIIFFCIIGAFSEHENVFDVYVMLLFGLFGYLLRKFEYELAPLVLAFILTPMLENALRQSLIISEGSFRIFFSRPIATGALIVAALLLFSSLLPSLRVGRALISRLKE
jgi:putative tricarboxylic transport membrane protein